MLCKTKLETLTISLNALDWEVLMLVGILKSPIMMWLSQMMVDRSWNSSRNKEVEDNGGR